MASADGTSQRAMSNHLERIRRTGKIEEAALIDFNGAVIISSPGMTISSKETDVLVHALESTYNSLTKLNVGNKTFTCFRCNMCCPALIGRSENDVINIYKCADFIVVAVSDPESPGSCIYEMTKFVKRYNRQSSTNSMVVEGEQQAEVATELTEIITDDRDTNKVTTGDKDRIQESNEQESCGVRTVIHPSDVDFKVIAQRDSYSDIDLAAEGEGESLEEKPNSDDTNSNLSNDEEGATSDKPGEAVQSIEDVMQAKHGEEHVTNDNTDEMKQSAKDALQAKHGEANAAFEMDDAAENTGMNKSPCSTIAIERDLKDEAVSVLASHTGTKSERDSGGDDVSHSALKHHHKHDNHVRFSMEINEYSNTEAYDEPDSEAFC